MVLVGGALLCWSGTGFIVRPPPVRRMERRSNHIICPQERRQQPQNTFCCGARTPRDDDDDDDDEVGFLRTTLGLSSFVVRRLIASTPALCTTDSSSIASRFAYLERRFRCAKRARRVIRKLPSLLLDEHDEAELSHWFDVVTLHIITQDGNFFEKEDEEKEKEEEKEEDHHLDVLVALLTRAPGLVTVRPETLVGRLCTFRRALGLEKGHDGVIRKAPEVLLVPEDVLLERVEYLSREFAQLDDGDDGQLLRLLRVTPKVLASEASAAACVAHARGAVALLCDPNRWGPDFFWSPALVMAALTSTAVLIMYPPDDLARQWADLVSLCETKPETWGLNLKDMVRTGKSSRGKIYASSLGSSLTKFEKNRGLLMYIVHENVDTRPWSLNTILNKSIPKIAGHLRMPEPELRSKIEQYSDQHALQLALNSLATNTW